jgi:Protein of unknown function (DUF3375)
MNLSYPELLQLFRTHPSWSLLRADHAPLVLAFLNRVFVQPNVRIMSQSNLAAKLEDMLYHLRRQGEGEGCYPRSAQAYLDEWAQDEKGWLRKFYPSGSDEPHFDLTPSTEKVLSWIESLETRSFVGTESRLLTIFELLRQMVMGAETDAEARIAELEKRKSELDAQIRSIRNGEIPVLDETALRERFMQFGSMARELLGDFRAVEHNFRMLDLQVREKIATWDGRKGELLEEIFGERDVITDSDQGRSFKAFWDFLMSSRSQEEFSALLDKVFSIEALSSLAQDARLKRIHFDWLDAGEHTQRTVALLSQQLRRYLDNQAYLENKRIMEILDAIVHHALAAKENMPGGGCFMTVDAQCPDINLPLERPLYAYSPQALIDSLVRLADGGDVDSRALFDQVYVDKDELMRNIQEELQSRNQISLCDVVAKHPLSKGLAELVSYLAIAGEDPLTVFDDAHTDLIRWRDSRGFDRQAGIARLIFNRMRQ